MDLLASLREFFSRVGIDKSYWIGFSGGLDSHVLLDACVTLAAEIPLKLHVIHVNHGLSPNSSAWSMHCLQKCEEYGVSFHAATLKLDIMPGDSLEEVARDARYAVFADCMQSEDMLLTAHQQVDQAETVLLQLFRGAGVKGLAAMPEIKQFAKGFHGRPLLNFSRDELYLYAVSKQLQWVDDESNNNLNLTRNYLRHEIFPRLKQRWPSVSTSIARTASHCASAQTVLDDYADTLLQQVGGTNTTCLSVAKLLQLDVDKQGLALRAWILREGHPLPDTKKIAAICQNVLMAAIDRQPEVEWRNSVVKRHRDDLYLLFQQEDSLVAQPKIWDLKDELLIAGIGKLISKRVEGGGIRADLGQIQVRFRKGGEEVNFGQRGHRSLKNLLQEWNVPVWQRDRIPLLFWRDKLISVVGYFVDNEIVAKDGVMGVDVVCEYQ